MFWGLLGIMLLAAALLAAWPVYQRQGRFSLLSAAMVIGIIAVSAGLYSRIGTPNVEAVNPGVPNTEDMIAALRARLQENPNDVEGWKMLGRSYVQLGNPEMAAGAFATAVELENSENGDTLISLGEAVLMQDESSIAGRAGQLFESGLALAPDNPRALFFAGLAAAQRGDTDLAADRWETLLALSPPPQIEDVLRQRVAQWRGVPMQPEVPPSTATDQTAAVFSVDITVGDEAAAVIDPSASVFVIARDPANPSPPLAVVRRKAMDLPAVVAIGDADAMIPGRVLSAYESLEFIVRVSASGQPIAQPGDWFGVSLMQRAAGASIEIVIDRQVP